MLALQFQTAQGLDVDLAAQLLEGEHRQFVVVPLDHLAEVAADVHRDDEHGLLRDVGEVADRGLHRADDPAEEPKKAPEPEELPVVEDVPVVPFSEETELPDFRIIGEAFKTYILVELEGKMLMVDKHAAHERILYDRLIANKEPVQSQMLLMPVTVSLSKEEYSAVLEQTDLLKEAGFEISDFGPGLIAVREVPVMLENEDVTVLLSEIAGKLLDKSDPTPAKLDWMYKNMACRAAVKAGDDTPPAEQEKFIEYVLSHREVRYCPHGRPILIEMTRPELEKTFGRIQLKTGPSVRQTVRRKKK